MHWPLKLSASRVLLKTTKRSECDFMWVDEHLVREVKLKVFDTVWVGGIEWLLRPEEGWKS